ncbi:protein BREAST CANCER SUSCEPTIBILITY 2 homolog B-like [Malania oleifera]|uniref:protein BREAST CANCER SUSCEPTIBILITY 2 homolog B-like n=1 Tax=Malania oleifera TaxID=397392 RepID=UPI0025ADEF4A|nr:protein BREAST CANCER SUSCEPTIBILITY 2 homolog B-like [Malania oleifera]
MSTWHIFTDDGNGFRWETSRPELNTKSLEKARPQEQSAFIQLDSSTARLPSMADLFFQGCSKLPENRATGTGSAPMFRTGLGKSVAVKQSSIAKALSVLGDDDCTDTGQVHAGEDRYGFPNSLFHTGTGKMVNISSAGLVRAKTLLELEESDTYHIKKQSNDSESSRIPNLSNLERRIGINNMGTMDATSTSTPLFSSKTVLLGSDLKINVIPNPMQPRMCDSALKPPPIKFHTAGGRSISVSSDALRRARSLLGDPELGTFLEEGNAEYPKFSSIKVGMIEDNSFKNENDPNASFTYQETAKRKQMTRSFASPLHSASNKLGSSIMSGYMHSAENLIKNFDANDHENVSRPTCKIPSLQKPSKMIHCAPHTLTENSLECGIDSSTTNSPGMLSDRPLADISNTICRASANKKETIIEKRRLGRRSSVSPFKRPRNSRFCTPLNSSVAFVPNGLSTLAPEDSCCRRRVSTRYPVLLPRMYVKEYFEVPPSQWDMLEKLPDKIRRMTPDNAEKYLFHDESGLDCIGVEAFYQLLVQSGASMQYVSKEWVANHYKWIVWKLACYERCYPTKSMGKFLKVSNVLEELKYRYEREVNHGHNSAIKRILEGDASPSSMMVLCISAIHSCDLKIETVCGSFETVPGALNGAQKTDAAKVELTDGWYSIDALLDTLLSKQLVSGKLYIGQKLRIWGAGLCGGWVGPVSPLEVPKAASLFLHMNGTYRAHWADRLGLCKGVGAPLALRCIKSAGGPVPQTLVGVKRIYPVLFKERLSNGGYIVRSERMETRMRQLYNQRCSTIIEGIISESEKGMKDSHCNHDSDSEEGAKISKILEVAAEPEVLMAEMSSEQLTSFATYQSKIEGIRQLEMQKSIEKALEDAGLSMREITPFMRVRVVGLTSKSNKGNGYQRDGLITIWNPTDKQKFELVEGQAYAVAGLVPLNSDSDTLYLQARGSTSRWQPLSPSTIKNFWPFFNPRQSVLLSSLGGVPLSSEFDIAALVVYVGEVYTVVHQKKQWVFVTDGSVSELQQEEFSSSLLAISFCSPCVDNDSFAPINHNLAGSVVGFCNLIKRAKDQTNHLWVAEATENSTYFLSYDLSPCLHLKNAAASAQRWAKISSLTIKKLEEKVLFIIGNCKGACKS